MVLSIDTNIKFPPASPFLANSVESTQFSSLCFFNSYLSLKGVAAAFVFTDVQISFSFPLRN